MTDEEILERILQSQIHVCHETLRISTYHRSKWTWKEITVDQHRGRWRLRLGTKRRTIYRNKLVWMYFHKRLVPRGYVVDHVDENRGNDHPSNLRLMSEQDSRKQGRRIQADKQYESWRLFFEYIEFCGHAPPEDSPYWEA